MQVSLAPFNGFSLRTPCSLHGGLVQKSFAFLPRVVPRVVERMESFERSTRNRQLHLHACTVLQSTHVHVHRHIIPTLTLRLYSTRTS
jgi:hypothetical protein